MGRHSKCRRVQWCARGAAHKGDCSAVRDHTFADQRTRQPAPDVMEHVTPANFNEIEDKEHPRK